MESEYVKPEPRALTVEEMRHAFMVHVWRMVKSWEQIENPNGSRVSGMAYSMLCLLDGNTGLHPGMLLIPDPHEEDKEFYVERGNEYYPMASLDGDIGGSLHEIFHLYDPDSPRYDKELAKRPLPKALQL